MSTTISDPTELDVELEIQLGRRAPFSQLGDWVRISGIDNGASSLYWDLSMHINTGRARQGDTEVWPGLRTLSRFLGIKKPEQVAPYMLQLEVIGSVDVIRSTVGLVRRNRYIVHQTPPAGYLGVRSIAEWYAINRPIDGETQEQREEREAEFDEWLAAVRCGLKEHCKEVTTERVAAKKAKLPVPAVRLFQHPRVESFRRTPKNGGTARPAEMPVARTFTLVNENDFTSPSAVPPKTGVRTPVEGGPVPPQMGVERDEDQTHEQTKIAGVDGRRPTTGGFARATPSNAGSNKPNPTSGSAASKKSPRPKVIKTSASKPVSGEEEVFAVIDALEISTSPAIKVPPLRRAVRDLLGSGRTPAHAIARINAGWWRAGAPEKLASGEIRRAVPYLAEIICARDCERSDCERGVILGSGEECSACGFRAAERSAERAQKRLEVETDDLDQAADTRRREVELVVVEAGDIRLPIPAPSEPVTWRCQAPGPDGFASGPCGRPGRGVPPAVRMCPDCLEAVRAALAG